MDLDGCVVALLRRTPNLRKGNLIMQGVAWHMGMRVELFTNDVPGKLICVIPDDLVRIAIPVTGVFRSWYPGADYYIVCGERFQVE